MQNINHGKYINYLILQSNSEINVLHEGKKNSLFPEDLRQGMIFFKKKSSILSCVSSIQIFIHLPIISFPFPLQDHFISFKIYNWIKSAFSTEQKQLCKYWWSCDKHSIGDRPLKRTNLIPLARSFVCQWPGFCFLAIKFIMTFSSNINRGLQFSVNNVWCGIANFDYYSTCFMRLIFFYASLKKTHNSNMFIAHFKSEKYE